MGGDVYALRFTDDGFSGASAIDDDVLLRHSPGQIYAALAGNLHMVRLGGERRPGKGCVGRSCVGELVMGGEGSAGDPALIGDGENLRFCRIGATCNGSVVDDGEGASGSLVLAIRQGAVVMERQASASEAATYQCAGSRVVYGESAVGDIVAVLQFLVVIHHDVAAVQDAIVHVALVVDREMVCRLEGGSIHKSAPFILHDHIISHQHSAVDGIDGFRAFGGAVVLHNQLALSREGRRGNMAIHQAVIGEVGFISLEGAAGDGPPIVHHELIGSFIDAPAGQGFLCYGQVDCLRLEMGVLGEAISEDGDMRLFDTGSLECAIDILGALVIELDAQGGHIVLPLHVLDIFDSDTHAFHIHVGLRLALVATFCQKAVFFSIFALKVDDYIAFRRVNGIHDEIAIGFPKAYSILRASGEDAISFDGGIPDSAAAGFEDQVCPIAIDNSEVIQTSGGLQAHLAAGGEFATCGDTTFTDEIDGATWGDGFERAGGLGHNGAHRGNGDRISTDGEVAALRRGQS